jgi:putative transposase
MTDEMMNLRALLEKSSDADLLREMIGFTDAVLIASISATAIATGRGRRSAADSVSLSKPMMKPAVTKRPEA